MPNTSQEILLFLSTSIVGSSSSRDASQKELHRRYTVHVPQSSLVGIHINRDTTYVTKLGHPNMETMVHRRHSHVASARGTRKLNWGYVFSEPSQPIPSGSRCFQLDGRIPLRLPTTILLRESERRRNEESLVPFATVCSIPAWKVRCFTFPLDSTHIPVWIERILVWP